MNAVLASGVQWNELPWQHPRRLALGLAQLGLVTILFSVCCSVAGANIGLTAAWAGVLVARLPVHRAIGFWPGMAYILWQVISRFGAQPGSADLHGLGQMYAWSGVLLAQVALADGLPGAQLARTWGLRLLALVAAVSCAVALGQYTIGLDDQVPVVRIGPAGERFMHSTGFFSIHLTQGVVLAAVAMLACCLPVWQGVAAAFRWTALIAGTLAVAISGGRLAYLGLGAGWSLALIAKGRRYALRGVLAGAAVAAVAVLVMLLTTPERLKSTFNMQDGRWPIWRTASALIVEHPLLGTGGPKAFKQQFHAAYPTVNPGIPEEFPEGAPHAHNSLLSLAAEHGIPLVLLYLALLGTVVVGCWKRSAGGPTGRTAVGLATLFLVAGMFENLSGQNIPSQCLWTFLGLLLVSGASATTGATLPDGITMTPPTSGHNLP